jgi:hypothetical protein
MNFNFLKILFIYTLWHGLSQKIISRYCPFKSTKKEARIREGKERTNCLIVAGNTDIYCVEPCRFFPCTVVPKTTARVLTFRMLNRD